MAMHTHMITAALADARALTELPDGTLVDVIAALLTRGERELAVELLLGANREQLYGGQKYTFYSRLLTGRHDDMIVAMAGSHSWLTEPSQTSFCVAIYPTEYFTLEEPLASQAAALIAPR